MWATDCESAQEFELRGIVQTLVYAKWHSLHRGVIFSGCRAFVDIAHCDASFLELSLVYRLRVVLCKYNNSSYFGCLGHQIFCLIGLLGQHVR